MTNFTSRRRRLVRGCSHSASLAKPFLCFQFGGLNFAILSHRFCSFSSWLLKEEVEVEERWFSCGRGCLFIAPESLTSNSLAKCSFDPDVVRTCRELIPGVQVSWPRLEPARRCCETGRGVGVKGGMGGSPSNGLPSLEDVLWRPLSPGRPTV